MGLKLFNTLTRSIEPFVPRETQSGKVGMYCCGPTVHDIAHIGNFRTFVFADLVRRYLEFSGYSIAHIMNITDVEDKIIARIRSERKRLEDFTLEKENAFWEDLDTLGCLRPHRAPHATHHIGDIIALIEKLMDRGLAYRAPDQSVYFSIQNYRERGHRYGQLINLKDAQLRPGERVSQDEYAKDSLADFALWKARVPDDGEVFWPSPWGAGRPGWHIECSAMSMKCLGPSFDLHLGGEDLIFPHHEDEIAQSEGAGLQPPGERFVRCWVHGAHLLVEGKKMSKSLGNFFTLRDLLAKGFTGREIRYLLLTAHYREPFNFTFDGLNGARTALLRLDEWHTNLRDLAGAPGPSPSAGVLEEFRRAMDEDLNVSAAWAAIFEWVRGTNRLMAGGKLPVSDALSALSAWERMSLVLGIQLTRFARVRTASEGAANPTSLPNEEPIPAELVSLLQERQKARQAKDFARADAIRNELREKGWVIDDTPQGARLKRVS